MDEFVQILASFNQELLRPQAGEEVLARANTGDLQAALTLAQSALQCQELAMRCSLCQLLARITHPGAAQVALFCLLGELSKRPQTLSIALAQLTSPDFIPSQALVGQLSTNSDPVDVVTTFAARGHEERRAYLQNLLDQDRLPLALQLPLEADDYLQLWSALQMQPELLADYLLQLPLHLLLLALKLPEVAERWPGLAALLPEDLYITAWLAPAQTWSVPAQQFSFERFPSETPYYDGSDGTLQGNSVCVLLKDNACVINEDWHINFAASKKQQDYTRLARHDRFFDDLSNGSEPRDKACSVSLSPDETLVALATLDGAVNVYHVGRKEIIEQVFEAGNFSERLMPSRIRFCAHNQWLTGVHQEHYFVWKAGRASRLEAVPTGLRGLFVRLGQLWSVCRDGAVYRLNLEREELVCELPATGVMVALSPNQRLISSYQADGVAVYRLRSQGLELLTHWTTPLPARMFFALEGQVLVLRFAQAGKNTPGERVWRMGWRIPDQLTLGEQERAITIGGNFWQELFQAG